MAGPDFGTEQGKVMLVVRALYGLKSSEADLRDLLDKKLHDLGYRPSISDPDVCMRLEVKTCGFMY